MEDGRAPDPMHARGRDLEFGRAHLRPCELSRRRAFAVVLDGQLAYQEVTEHLQIRSAGKQATQRRPEGLEVALHLPVARAETGREARLLRFEHKRVVLVR